MVTRKDSNAQRLKRHKRVRAKISGTPETPRLCVYRSLNNISVQIIDDTKGVTLVSASTLEAAFEGNGGNKEAAKQIGETIAKRALEKGIENVYSTAAVTCITDELQSLQQAPEKPA